jgi:hypothetical protein
LDIIILSINNNKIDFLNLKYHVNSRLIDVEMELEQAKAEIRKEKELERTGKLFPGVLNQKYFKACMSKFFAEIKLNRLNKIAGILLQKELQAVPLLS